MLKYVALSVALMSALSLSEGQADAATMDLKQLQSMLSGLGVPATVDSDEVHVKGQGKFDSDIAFSLSADKSTVGVSASFEAIPPEKRSMVPYADLLTANVPTTWSRFEFALCHSKTSDWICLGANFDAASLNKKSLRAILDEITGEIDENEPLWNAAKWVAGPIVPSDAKAVYDAAWEASPMQIDNAMFVTDKAPSYGAFAKRSTNVFKPGEDMIAYVEPKNFHWQEDGTGGFTFGVVVDAAILNDKGEVIYEKLKSMGPLSFASREHVQELMLNLTFTLTGAPAGDYTLRYTVHDTNGPKSAIVALPFKVEG
jgi:hypothetical protein